jgi:putative peptidoglycan lipid II flippase
LSDAQTLDAAVRMTRVLLPAQLFFFSGGLFMAVQFCRERFFIPALAPLIYNLGIIGGGLTLGRWLGMEGFAWGVLAGAASGNGLLQLWGARRAGLRWVAAFGLHPDLGRYLRLSLPLMLGLTMSFSTEIFFKLFGSFLPAGAIASLNYGLRLMLMVVALCGQALGAASYPFLARLAAEGRRAELHRLLDASLRLLALVIPFSALMVALRHELVLILFQRGRFDAAATALTARLLVPLMAGAFAFAAQSVVARGFYALQNTWLPALWGSAATLISVPLYWAGLRWAGADGVAWAVSLAAMLQVAVLWGVWSRFGGNAAAGELWRGYGRMLLLGVGLAAVLELAVRALQRLWDGTTPAGALLTAVVTAGLFGLLLALAARVFRIEELIELARRVRGALQRQRR